MAQFTTQEFVLEIPATTVHIDDLVQLRAAHSQHLMGYSDISMNACFQFLLKDKERKRLQESSWQRLWKGFWGK